METRKLLFGIALITLGFSSCKDEKEVQAEKSVDTYVVYVDSLGKIESENIKGNWQNIDSTYELRNAEAEAALTNLKDNTKAQERINASRAKYEELKAEMDAELQA